MRSMELAGERRVTLAVVIATFNRDQTLVDTLESVRAQDPPPDEVWVIDQTARHEEGTERYLQEAQDRGVRVVRLPSPGVCFARNLGAALAGTDVVLFLDDDVILHRPGFFARHAANYLDPQVHAVQGQVLNQGQEPTGDGLQSGYAPNNFSRRVAGVCNFVTANASVRRSALLAVGGFDEGFSGRTYANEDGDLGRRLVEAGFRIDFDPEAGLLHLQAPSGGNRITGRDAFPEWTRSVTFFQYRLRHARGTARLASLLKVFRTIALRRENVVRPWRAPVALLHAVYGLAVALGRHRRGFRSSLRDPGPEALLRAFAGGCS